MNAHCAAGALVVETLQHACRAAERRRARGDAVDVAHLAKLRADVDQHREWCDRGCA